MNQHFDELRKTWVDALIRDLGGEDLALLIANELKPFTSDEESREHLLNNKESFLAQLAHISDLSSLPNEFVGDEVVSEYGYRSGYKPNITAAIDSIIADFESQIRILNHAFNCGIKFNPDWIVSTHPSLPYWVEKHFACFDWKLIGGTYGEATQAALNVLERAYGNKLQIYRSGLSTGMLKQVDKSASAWEGIFTSQSLNGARPDVAATPAQFGYRHRGRSARRAHVAMNANECGLGTFACILMLLTHPERLRHNDDLCIDCIGDVYYSTDERDFSEMPKFRRDVSDVNFITVKSSDSSSQSAPVSMWIPSALVLA